MREHIGVPGCVGVMSLGMQLDVARRSSAWSFTHRTPSGTYRLLRGFGLDGMRLNSWEEPEASQLTDGARPGANGQAGDSAKFYPRPGNSHQLHDSTTMAGWRTRRGRAGACWICTGRAGHLPWRGPGGQQERRQDGDDGNHHEQLNQGKTRSGANLCSPFRQRNHKATCRFAMYNANDCAKPGGCHSLYLFDG